MTRRRSSLRQWSLRIASLLATSCLSCATSTATDVQTASPKTTEADCSFPAGDLEVHFQTHDGLWLEGTASFPKRDSKQALPAVVLAHPEGAQSRDGATSGQWGLDFGFEIRVLEELAQSLTSHGFVVLRFDKRSCSRANACADNDYPPIEDPAYVYDLVGDVNAAISAASRLPGVHAEDVHLFGYGESAAFVPAVLRDNAHLRSAVAFGLNREHIGHAMLERAQRLERIGTASGLSETEVDAEVARLKRFGWDLTELALFGTGGANPVADRPDAFWIAAIRQHLQSVPPYRWSRDKALLLLYGGADWTLGSVDVQGWNQSITKAQVNGLAVSLPCVTHALNCITEEDPARITPEHIGQHVDPAVLDMVSQHFEANRRTRVRSPHAQQECRDGKDRTPLRLVYDGAPSRSASAAACSQDQLCQSEPIPFCKPGLHPAPRQSWQDGQRVTYAARLGLRRDAVPADGRGDAACGGGDLRMFDLRETLAALGVDFEFAGQLGTVCNVFDSAPCCPVQPHTKDGGGLVIARGTVDQGRLLDVQLCRPRPEHYSNVINFDPASPPLRDHAGGANTTGVNGTLDPRNLSFGRSNQSACAASFD